jgi:hypothetical protein
MTVPSRCFAPVTIFARGWSCDYHWLNEGPTE